MITVLNIQDWLKLKGKQFIVSPEKTHVVRIKDSKPFFPDQQVVFEENLKLNLAYISTFAHDGIHAILLYNARLILYEINDLQ